MKKSQEFISLSTQSVDEEQGDATCLLGRQATTSFFGCICGSIGMLAFQKWVVTVLFMSFGTIWGMVSLCFLENASERHILNRRIGIKNVLGYVIAPTAVIICVCYVLLDIHQLVSVVYSSIISSCLLMLGSRLLQSRNGIRVQYLVGNFFHGLYVKRNLDDGQSSFSDLDDNSDDTGISNV